MVLDENMLGYTHNITTGIALETSRGVYAQGIALGITLLMLAFARNSGLHWLQGRSHLPGGKRLRFSLARAWRSRLCPASSRDNGNRVVRA